MTITLDLQPEIEKGLLARAQAKGVSLIDYLQEIVTREANVPRASEVGPTGEAQTLYELFAPVRGLLTDEEIDTLFARNPSHGRPVDFE